MTQWIIATDDQVSSLIETARALGGSVTAVVAGDVEIGGVDRVIAAAQAEDAPVEALAPAFADAVEAQPGDGRSSRQLRGEHQAGDAAQETGQ